MELSKWSNLAGSSEVAVMMKVTEGEVSQVKALAKAMKRRLPQQETRGDGINVSKENSVAYPAKEALRYFFQVTVSHNAPGGCR